jgi:hypothetical protein
MLIGFQNGTLEVDYDRHETKFHANNKKNLEPHFCRVPLRYALPPPLRYFADILEDDVPDSADRKKLQLFYGRCMASNLTRTTLLVNKEDSDASGMSSITQIVRNAFGSQQVRVRTAYSMNARFPGLMDDVLFNVLTDMNSPGCRTLSIDACCRLQSFWHRSPLRGEKQPKLVIDGGDFDSSRYRFPDLDDFTSSVRINSSRLWRNPSYRRHAAEYFRQSAHGEVFVWALDGLLNVIGEEILGPELVQFRLVGYVN